MSTQSVLPHDAEVETGLWKTVAELVPADSTSAEDVAAFLEDSHIVGVPSDPWQCPLTRYFTNRLKARGLLREGHRVGIDWNTDYLHTTVRVGPLSSDVYVLSQPDFVAELELPQVLHHFLKLLDEGVFPWLVEA